MVLLAVLLAGVLMGPARAEAVALPSGQALVPVDALWEDDSGHRVLVLRFLVPAIARSGGTLGYDDVIPDMDAICDGIGLPLEAMTGAQATQIVVVLMDRHVPRGQPDPEATQFINSYAVEDGACIWEDF